MENNSILIRIIMYFLMALAVSGSGLFIYPKLFPPNIDKIVAETNARLEYSVINFLDAPFITSIEGNENLPIPKRSLLIEISPKYINKVVNFTIKEYTLTSGGSKGKLPPQILELCSAVDSVYDRKDKIIEAIGGFEISTGFGKFFEISKQLQIVPELYYFFRRLYEIKTDKIEIFVKGYADGTASDWEERLEEDYDGENYRSFKVHPPLRPKSKNQFNFLKEEVTYEVPLKFKNEHLPNLRARFMQLDIIDFFFKTHLRSKGIPNKNISVGILNGKFKHKDYKDRKVEIFVNIY